MKKMDQIQILPPDRDSQPYQQDSSTSSQTTGSGKNDWVLSMAKIFVDVLCEDSLDFSPHDPASKLKKALALADAFIAQGECVLGDEIDGPRFSKALSLCKGRFRKFPSARGIIDLLPIRPKEQNQLLLEDRIPKEARMAGVAKAKRQWDGMFKDTPSCDPIAAHRDEPTV